MKPTWIVGLIVMAGAGFVAGAFSMYQFGPSQAPSGLSSGKDHASRSTGKQPEGERPRAVVALANLEPEGGVVNIGVPMGDRLEKLLVKEGDDVKKDQPLAELESHSDRQADRDLAASQLQDAERRLAAVTVTCKSAIREAEIHLEQVQKIEPLDIQAQEARVRLLLAQNDTSEADLKRLKSLKQGSVPDQQLDLQELAANKAREELAAARALLKKVQEGHDLNVEAAKAQLDAAKANLDRYQAEIPVASLKQSLVLAESRLRHSIIKAPSDGKIFKIISHPGETLGGRPILQMGDIKHMQAVARVYETEVKFVHKGDVATISSPALPVELTGKVVSVGSIVAKNLLLELDPTAAADQRVVEVKVQLDSPGDAAGFVNLQVKVAITPGS